MHLKQSNRRCSSITQTSFVSVVSNFQQQIYSISLQLGDNLERSRTLLHYFYCESFVHLFVFDALLSLTWNSCKYQILFESFLILVVLRVSFSPCTNKKIKTEIGYKYERELASKQMQNKLLSQDELFHMKFTWSSHEQPPLPLCSHDPTPRIAATCCITALGPTEGRGYKNTSRESMRKRRHGGKSELRSWSCCFFSSLSSRDDTIGLVIYYSCSHRFSRR